MSRKAQGTEVLDLDAVQALRLDWMRFVKNIDRVRTITQAEEFYGLFKTYAKHTNGVFGRFRLHLRLRAEAAEDYQSWRPDYPDAPFAADLKRLNSESYILTQFSDDLDRFPRPKRRDSLEVVRNRMRGDGRSEEDIRRYLDTMMTTEAEAEAWDLEDWQGEASQWEKGTKRRASQVWKWLKSYVIWTMKVKKEVTLYETGKPEVVQMGEFTLLVENYSGEWQTQMGEFQQALKLYKQRAAIRVPLLLKKKVPFRILFGRMGGGSYNGGEITIHLGGTDLNGIVHTIAHEMGHHLWNRVLSGAAKKRWEAFIQGDYGTLDLREIVIPGEKDHDTAIRLRKKDPILYLQWLAILESSIWRFYRVRSIQEYLDQGNTPVLRVPKTPITGYAAKRPDEAFCEALGLLIGYGPKALLPKIRALLQIVLPEVRMASTKRIASLWIARQTGED